MVVDDESIDAVSEDRAESLWQRSADYPKIIDITDDRAMPQPMTSLGKSWGSFAHVPLTGWHYVEHLQRRVENAVIIRVQRYRSEVMECA